MDASRTKIALTVILLFSACLRFYGIGWGTHPETGNFHRFHPDETTVVESSGWIGTDMRKIVAPYGKAPMYFLWALGQFVSAATGSNPLQETDNDSIRLAHLLGRGISATFGTLTVLLVFLIGRNMANPQTGLLAAALLGFCAGHIQQCHYYTVDVSLAFWVTLALWYMIRMPSQDTKLYLYCGIACGLATGTRLAGVWLGVPFLLAHLWGVNWKSLLSRQFAVYFLAAVITTLICEPFLVLDPAHFFSDDKVLQLMGSIKVVSGEHIQILTLVDFDTFPYLYHITHLLPYPMGTALTAASIAGVIAVLAKKHKPGIILLAWVSCYFLTIGYLHSKPIRYTVPMVPLLIVISAWASIQAKEFLHTHQKKILISVIPIILVGAPSVIYGLSFTKIYFAEDSRFVAERWAQKHIPDGASVLVERGGFPTSWMVSSDRNNIKVDDAGYFLVAENHLPYWSQIKYIETKVADAEYILIIEENRMKQFLHVPTRYPVAHGFYSKLLSGKLGFDRIERFKISPAIAGRTFSETVAEPTITAFDHPAVSVFRRRTADVRANLTEWISEIGMDEHMPDRYIKLGMASYHAQEWEAAADAFAMTIKVRPEFMLGHLLLREVYLRQGKKEEASRQWNLAAPGNSGIPVEARMGMIKAGMKAEGVVYLERFLRIAHETGRGDPVRIANAIARVRFDLGVEHHQKGLYDSALEHYRVALEHDPDLNVAQFNLGILLYNLRNYEQSTRAFENVVRNTPDDWQAHLALAQAYDKVDRPADAALSYRRALALDPENKIAKAELEKRVFPVQAKQKVR
jgi:tetratricopeptide (TPR) repeat protein/4-amino-4-deoxy-L-arabinose transferase-like glycosyltransferase